MNWRGAWILFDRELGITYVDDGRALPESVDVFWISLIASSALLLMVASRSLKNNLTVPFVIGVDTKDSLFDFPTRFKFNVST